MSVRATNDPAPCVVCGEPASFVCDQRIPRVVRLSLKLIRATDSLVRGRDGINRAPRYRIVRVELIGSYDSQYRWRGYAFGYLSLIGNGGRGTVKARASARFRIERSFWCSAPVCFRHVRELDENYHFCLNCSRQMEDRSANAEQPAASISAERSANT
jgi:hypothetical protein